MYSSNMMSLEEMRKQSIIRVRSSQIASLDTHNGKEALLCTCIGYKTTMIVHIILHYMTNFKTRSSQIYLWKALFIK